MLRCVVAAPIAGMNWRIATAGITPTRLQAARQASRTRGRPFGEAVVDRDHVRRCAADCGEYREAPVLFGRPLLQQGLNRRPPGSTAWYFQCEIPAPRFRYRAGGPHYRG